MTTKHDPNRYRVTLSTGREFTYDPRLELDGFPWRSVQTGMHHSSGICRTPADYRACAEVVERWEADHAPKMRRRVGMEEDGWRWARHETLNCFVACHSDADVRREAANPRYHGRPAIIATDANLAMLADLAARPDEEVPRGE
jgi:hypothetical protein